MVCPCRNVASSIQHKTHSCCTPPIVMHQVHVILAKSLLTPLLLGKTLAYLLRPVSQRHPRRHPPRRIIRPLHLATPLGCTPAPCIRRYAACIACTLHMSAASLAQTAKVSVLHRPHTRVRQGRLQAPQRIVLLLRPAVRQLSQFLQQLKSWGSLWVNSASALPVLEHHSANWTS